MPPPLIYLVALLTSLAGPPSIIEELTILVQPAVPTSLNEWVVFFDLRIFIPNQKDRF